MPLVTHNVPNSPADSPAAPPVERRHRPRLRVLWRVAFGLLFAAWTVLLLAWLTLHWLILPRIDQWRPQIEIHASRALGVPVSIGTISVRSGGWMPVLALSDVVLRDQANREALRLPLISATLSARSLLAFGLRFEQLHIDGPVLEVRRDSDGRVFIAGIEMPSSGGDASAADWFFSQREFVIRHGRLRWIDERRAAPTLELEQVDIVVRNGLRSHDMRLDATPPIAWGKRFSVRGRLSQPLFADSGDWRRWSGQLHLALPRADVAQLRQYVNLPFELNAGDGELRAWVDVTRGQWRGATADLALRAVSLQLGRAVEPLNIARLQGRVRAERGDEHLRLSTEGLSFDRTDGTAWPRSDLALTLRQSHVGSTTTLVGGDLSADRLDLGAMTRLAPSVPLGAALSKLLAELAPTGQVRALSAQWDGSLDAPTKYRVKASVSGLSIASAAASAAQRVGRPGWRNAAMEFDANEAGGTARLSLDKGALALPGVFEQPQLEFDRLSTHLAWRVRPVPGAPAALSLTLTDTRFANADVQGELSLLTWRTGSGGGSGRGTRLPGQLELAGSFSRGRAAAVARYLPLGLPESARRYVQRAVVDGRIASAVFKVKGDLSDFPFAAHPGGVAPPSEAASGEFHIAARVEALTLAYVPSEPDRDSPWPAFEQLSGDLLFERRSMTIRNAQARLWGVDLTRVNGGIDDLAHPVLRMDGQAHGPAADLLRYVNATPIAGWTHHTLREAGVNGSAELALALELPLATPTPASVRGHLLLGGNDVSFGPGLPVLARAKARVDFTQDGISIAGGSARILGGDARFDGGVLPDGTLRFQGVGVVSAEGLRRATELGPVTRLAASMSGQTPYRLTLGVVRGHSEFTLTSPLTGLALNLPAPLAKSVNVAWPLRVEKRLAGVAPPGAEPLRDDLRIELGNVLQAKYQRDWSSGAPQVLRGAIGVLGPLPSLPERGVRAVLDLPAIDGDAWRALVSRLTASAEVGIGVADDYLPRSVALRAQALTLGGRQLTQLVAGVSLDAADATWRGSVDAAQLGGYVEYRAARGPGNPGRVYARLARVALPPAEADSVEQLLVQAPTTVTVPALDIVIDEFELRGKRLGRVEIEAVNRAREGGGREWHLGRFTVSNPAARLSGSGQWQAAGSGPSGQRMVMDFKLAVDDGGALLERLGQGGTLRGGTGQLNGQLSWAGSPLSPHVPSLRGHVNVALDAGQFLKAGPGAGRLLSILSLQSLPRRLQLDFRDVFQEGFAFDNFTGDVRIDDGVASTNNLRMRGVQAAVLMEGSADIVGETQNLRVIVVPEINAGTASLAYAAINPAVGLGTFLAQMILRRPLIAAGTREFRVQGPWADPKVERVVRPADAPLVDINGAVPPAASAPVPGS